MTAGTDTPSLPSALTALRRKLAPGWASHVTGPATGVLTVNGLSEVTDGEGKRTRTTRDAPVTSYVLRARHCETLRAFVAVWYHQHGKLTKAGNLSWTMDAAVRGRHDGEHTPQHMDARQLAAYAASRTTAEYLASLDGLAARRAAKQAPTTDLLTSVPTEEAA